MGSSTALPHHRARLANVLQVHTLFTMSRDGVMMLQHLLDVDDKAYHYDSSFKAIERAVFVYITMRCVRSYVLQPRSPCLPAVPMTAPATRAARTVSCMSR